MQSLNEFWAKYVNGTDPVDYQKYFGFAGIRVIDQNADKKTPYLGIATRRTEGHILVAAVSRNSGAWVDGINVGDEVLSVDGVTAEPAVEKMAGILNKKVGDVISVKVRRDDLEKDIKVTIKSNPNLKLAPSMDGNVSDTQRMVLKKWMGL
jgi:predicted metalloprotease with PDZ domain